jgi:hypothetical protein
MSTEAEHLALANRNQAALDHLLLDVPKCSEWMAVAAFYKSLHVVEAVFAREPKACHLHDHHARLDKLKATRTYSLLYPHYRAMWSAGLVARYLAHQPGGGAPSAYACFDDYLPAADIRSKLLDNYLFGFEHMAVQLLGLSAGALRRYTKTPGP